MAVSAKWYGNAFVAAFNKEIDFNSDTIKISLHTSSYTPNQDTDAYVDDLSNEVSAGGGYTTGGKTLASCTASYDAGSNTFSLDATDVSWTSATFTARYAVIYDDTPGTTATKPLIGYIDFGEDQSPSNGTLSITFDSAGIATVTVD
jgi:hypothetical protein